eukprot:GHVT01081406.1.p1 GENE.GHVT01081406.1~~GHVT01081406.1.p1  ORF type:complete len:106 (-),score=12.14 GHVT01081406.1:421-738(-)
MLTPEAEAVEVRKSTCGKANAAGVSAEYTKAPSTRKLHVTATHPWSVALPETAAAKREKRKPLVALKQVVIRVRAGAPFVLRTTCTFPDHQEGLFIWESSVLLAQ